MSSIAWPDRCPQCQNSATFDAGSRGYHITCNLCGYTYCREGKWNPKTKEYDIPKIKRLDCHREYEQKGYGVMFLAGTESPGDYYYLNNPVTPAVIKKFLKRLSDPLINENDSYLTRWDEDSRTVIAVVGRIDDLDDCGIDNLACLEPFEFPPPHAEMAD